MKTILYFSLTFLFISVGVQLSSFATTIKLKSGKTVEGKIIERTNDYIKINFLGVELKYYFDQIADVIEEEQQQIIQPIFKEEYLPEKSIPDKTVNKEIKGSIFKDINLNYSIVLPSSWSKMEKSELKPVMIDGFKPLTEDSLVTIQMQAGKFSETDILGKTTLVDLINMYLKPNPELKREFIKPVTLRYESGYLIRYTYSTVQTLYDTEGVFYIPVKVFFDYYFFSPVFSTQGKDRRVFLIELTYVEFEDITSDVDSLKNRLKIYELNSYYKKLNRRYEDICWEAREIINSFRLSL